jgi:hypothetical protein
MIQKVKISKVKPNKDNPRLIKDNKFKKLVRSIKDFPEMLELRPIVVNNDNVVLGGNMRLKACKEAGLKEVYILKAKDLTEEQQKEFIVKDNVGFGEWDWDILGNEWNVEKLEEWGLEGFPFEINTQVEDEYNRSVEVPKYKPNEIKPKVNELFDNEKTNKFIENIEKADIPKEEKDFLIKAAHRHIKFNYKNIADYYAHANKEVQELMEDSALVIIDFNKAIENGYVSLSDKIQNQYKSDYGE